jgi:hypothetical protein
VTAQEVITVQDGVKDLHQDKIQYLELLQLTVAADQVVGDIHRVVEVNLVGVAVQEVLEAVEVTPEMEQIVVEE